jgi:hypothetical protein
MSLSLSCLLFFSSDVLPCLILLSCICLCLFLISDWVFCFFFLQGATGKRVRTCRCRSWGVSCQTRPLSLALSCFALPCLVLHCLVLSCPCLCRDLCRCLCLISSLSRLCLVFALSSPFVLTCPCLCLRLCLVLVLSFSFSCRLLCSLISSCQVICNIVPSQYPNHNPLSSTPFSTVLRCL